MVYFLGVNLLFLMVKIAYPFEFVWTVFVLPLKVKDTLTPFAALPSMVTNT